MSGDILWMPSTERIEASSMAHFERFLEDTRGLTFEDYNAMWHWSVDDLETFWNAIWDFFNIRASVRPETLLVKREMPDIEWGTGGQLNYAENILKHVDDLI